MSPPKITPKIANVVVKPSDLEALASDRDIWMTVCDTGLRSFLNGWITASEERRAARHTA